MKKYKPFLVKAKNYFYSHKKISAVLVLILLFIGYKAYGSLTDQSGKTRYVVASVEKGTIVSTVSGTGQVSASSQIDLKPRVSGDVVYVGVRSGQSVARGTLIAQLDATDANIALENAKISLEKLTRPADKIELLQAENALADAKDANKKAGDDLAKAYEDGFTAVANTFLDLPDIMTELNDLIYDYGTGALNDAQIRTLGRTAENYRNTAAQSLSAAKKKHDANLAHYKNLTRTSASSSIEALILETYETAKAVSQATKDAKNAVDYVKSQIDDRNASEVITAQTNLATWTDKANNHLGSLLSIKNSIENSKNSLAGSTRDIRSKEESLIKLKDGADPLDIRSQQLSVQQKQSDLADYYIRAPFDGVVQVNAKVGDSISGTSIGTFITKQKMAEIALNEVDVAKVKVGQRVTLTFDAVPDLSITGEVAEIDLVGAVSQGVVSYNVKIGFDTQDDRIKSGMSVSAAIATAVRQDVVVVPNSAIKTQNNVSAVQVVPAKTAVSSGNQGVVLSVALETQTVEIGIADDENTEIVSGLKVGDKIVARTIAPSATRTTSQAPSLIGGGGGFRPTTGGGNRNFSR